MKKDEKPARILFLSRALDDLNMLVFSANVWLSEDKCRAFADEVEAAVRSLAARVEAYIPENVAPVIPGGDSRIAEVVHISLREVRKSLALIGRIGKTWSEPDEPPQPNFPANFAAEAEELRKLRGGELNL